METCPKYLACPIFQKTVAASEQTLENFKNLYCNAGKEAYSQCKRFIVAQQTGHAPPAFVMPNSQLSIDEIIELTNKK